MTMELPYFRKKDWVQARAYPGGLGGVLPTQKLLETNLASPENFIQICSPVQKLFMIYCRTDTQMDIWTDTQTPYKMNHPSTL